MTYEQRRAHDVLGDDPKEPRATLAVAESESQLASLSLEPWGKTLNLDDVEMLRLQVGRSGKRDNYIEVSLSVFGFLRIFFLSYY